MTDWDSYMEHTEDPMEQVPLSQYVRDRLNAPDRPRLRIDPADLLPIEPLKDDR